MQLLFRAILLAAFGLYACSVAAVGHSAEIPAMPAAPVVDLAGIIDNHAETKLNRYLKELETKTGAQMAILTVISLEGQAIEEFSINIAHDQWKLGQKGKDNGVLVVVSLNDKKYRIEVGYGLEGLLPDSLVGGIGRQYLVPYFKRGDYSTGIYAAVSRTRDYFWPFYLCPRWEAAAAIGVDPAAGLAVVDSAAAVADSVAVVHREDGSRE